MLESRFKRCFERCLNSVYLEKFRKIKKSWSFQDFLTAQQHDIYCMIELNFANSKNPKLNTAIIIKGATKET